MWGIECLLAGIDEHGEKVGENEDYLRVVRIHSSRSRVPGSRHKRVSLFLVFFLSLCLSNFP